MSADVGKIGDLLNEDTYNKIKDFLKNLWADKMFEADKKLKMVDAAIDKLLWRIAEVNRENDDFKSVLNGAQDPSD